MKRPFLKQELIAIWGLLILTLPVPIIAHADELPPPIPASMNFEQTLLRRNFQTQIQFDLVFSHPV